ncbi:tetratricopeptide repeat protein [Roseicyclus marinus]|nr:tetratricopeptide repeat protein [Roseicyclus marinus]
MKRFISLAGFLALSGCIGSQADDRLDPLPRELEIAAPAGTVVLQDEVDQVLVGDRLMDAGQHDLALRAYYRAAAERGIDAEVLTSIGAANLALGRIGQAERQFREAIEIDESFVPAINNLGVVLMEQGEYGEARRIFERAFALDSGSSDAIRDNLRLSIARMEDSVYGERNNQEGLGLIRRGGGVFELRRDP